MDDNNNSTTPSSDSLPAGTTPPIPGIEDPYGVKTSHDQYHSPVTTPPEEAQKAPIETPPSGTEKPITPPPSDSTGETTPQTPSGQPYPGTLNDIPGNKSSDLA